MLPVNTTFILVPMMVNYRSKVIQKCNTKLSVIIIIAAIIQSL